MDLNNKIRGVIIKANIDKHITFITTMGKTFRNMKNQIFEHRRGNLGWKK